MISVSDSFKKAIKSENREIFGYVDVKYQNKTFNTEITQIPANLNIVSDNGIINGEKTMQKYATLENNYTLLDGSFMVWNENIILNSGYISDDVFEDINDTTIIITNNSTNISTKGITIYFKENLPFNFNVTITDIDDNTIIDTITNNQSYVYQYIFNEEKYIKSVTINVLNIEFPKNRLRIAYIDFNVSDLYEGDELVNFDVTEELDLLIESLPVNTCSVNINNYPDSRGRNKFDPINPKGIVEYLNDGVTIEPYIGVLTEDNGVEYVPMGVFYLSDWTSDNDGNITINGVSALGKIQNMVIPNEGGFFALTTPEDVSEYLTNHTKYNFVLYNGNYAFNNNELIINNLLEYIHLLLLFNSCYIHNNKYYFRKFYVNRFNQITLRDINTELVDKISRNNLIEDVIYETRNKIYQLNIKYKSISQMGDITRKVLINDTHTLSTEEEYVWYNISNNRISDNNPSFSYSVISGSGTAELVDKNLYFMIVKYSGTINSQISVVYNNGIQSENKNIKDSITTYNVDNGNNLTIDASAFGYFYPQYLELIQKYYLNMDKKYKITAQTMGDPSITIGDTISIQTRYQDVNNGYKDVIITKQQFTYDGGLQCSLEGVGD